MRSIRLSLLVYFLGLVAVALGVASLLVDNITQLTLREKEEAAKELINKNYDEREREASNRLKERLLGHARELAGRVRPRERWDRISRGQYHLQGLTLLTAGQAPNGHVLSLLPILQGAASERNDRRGGWIYLSSVQRQLWFGDLIELSLNQDVALSEDGDPSGKEGDAPRICAKLQTNGWSRPLLLRSASNLRLPDESNFAPRERLTWDFDDPILDDGTRVHRVRFRALMTLRAGPPGPPSGPSGARSSYRLPPPALIIQCAANAQELDAALASLRQQRDAERETLREETAKALAHQRNWLLAICGATFAAAVLGCIGLVWLGLRPLRKLSDAVSQVTPQNFMLHLENESLPAELEPIVETLTGSLDLLKRAFAREKQATADISHELRTPLAALLTTIELALRKQRSPEQYRELLEECHLSAKQMHQMVERLLTLARLDAGVDRLRPQNVDVAELATQCVTVIRPLAEARGLHLSVHNRCEAGDEELSRSQLTTDPDKLREVLNNLLHNAIQYNRPAGRIDLTVSRENGHVEMEVHDTGVGIPPEARQRIFERFFRADPSRNGDGLHSGLGLAIVKEYVELMGGKISVESEEGLGSTFRVKLPAA